MMMVTSSGTGVVLSGESALVYDKTGRASASKAPERVDIAALSLYKEVDATPPFLKGDLL